LYLTSAFDASNKKVQQNVDQFNSVVHQLQIIEKESSQYRAALDQALLGKKAGESKIVELSSKLNEITSINLSLSQKTSKIEKELSAVSADYSDIARELKLADERANKATHDAQYCEGLLREEQAKNLKVENSRKALETEVRSLTLRMEEIESSSFSNTKKSIQKMELIKM